jgi:hypothetical protein
MLTIKCRSLLIAGLVGALAAGCGQSPGPNGSQQVVFRMPTGFSNGGPAFIQRILDLGLPLLHSLSDSTVRLRSVQLVSPGSAVRLISATAYLFSRTDGTTIAAFGDLPAECPRTYVPHPLSAAVTGPHSDSNWTVILALRISRLGRYRFIRVKINYTVNGQRGWQYYNLYDYIHAVPGYGPHWKGCAGASG